MLKPEERARKVAEWLERLQAWKDSGDSLSSYARSHGLALWSAYHWRRILTREGSWHEQISAREHGKRSNATRSRRVPLSFARVTVTNSARTAPLVIRMQLTNGRRAEIALDEIEHLGAVLSVLERSA